jgi:hypothetical protein
LSRGVHLETLHRVRGIGSRCDQMQVILEHRITV